MSGDQDFHGSELIERSFIMWQRSRLTRGLCRSNLGVVAAKQSFVELERWACVAFILAGVLCGAVNSARGEQPTADTFTRREVQEYTRHLAVLYLHVPDVIHKNAGTKRVTLGIAYLAKNGDAEWQQFAKVLRTVIKKYHPKALTRPDRPDVPDAPAGGDRRRDSLIATGVAIVRACTAITPRKDRQAEMHPDAKRDLLRAIVARCPSSYVRYGASEVLLRKIFPDPEGWDRYRMIVRPRLAGPAMQQAFLQTLADASGEHRLEALVTLNLYLQHRGMIGAGVGGATILGGQPPTEAAMNEKFEEASEAIDKAIASSQGLLQRMLQALQARAKQLKPHMASQLKIAKMRWSIEHELSAFFKALGKGDRKQVVAHLSPKLAKSLPPEASPLDWFLGDKDIRTVQLLNVGVPSGNNSGHTDIVCYYRMISDTGEMKQQARRFILKKGDQWMIQTKPQKP